VPHGERAVKLAPDPTSHAYAMGFLGYARLVAGSETALDTLKIASAETSKLGCRPFEGLFLAYLAEAELRAGRIGEACATARQGVSAAVGFSYLYAEAWAHRALAHALAASANESEAAAAANNAAQLFERVGAMHELDRIKK
jgi:hypothetical protein